MSTGLWKYVHFHFDISPVFVCRECGKAREINSGLRKAIQRSELDTFLIKVQSVAASLN
jgi:hypothetical protein